MSQLLHCTVNGRAVAREIPDGCTLLTFLREHLGLTGTKEGQQLPLSGAPGGGPGDHNHRGTQQRR